MCRFSLNISLWSISPLMPKGGRLRLLLILIWNLILFRFRFWTMLVKPLVLSFLLIWWKSAKNSQDQSGSKKLNQIRIPIISSNRSYKIILRTNNKKILKIDDYSYFYWHHVYSSNFIHIIFWPIFLFQLESKRNLIAIRKILCSQFVPQ